MYPWTLINLIKVVDYWDIANDIWKFCYISIWLLNSCFSSCFWLILYYCQLFTLDVDVCEDKTQQIRREIGQRFWTSRDITAQFNPRHRGVPYSQALFSFLKNLHHFSCVWKSPLRKDCTHSVGRCDSSCLWWSVANLNISLSIPSGSRNASSSSYLSIFLSFGWLWFMS